MPSEDRLGVLETSIKPLDDMLQGGLSYGSLHCIGSEAGTAVPEILLGLLTTHLLSNQSASATVIDTLSSFDVRKLHQRLSEVFQSKKRDNVEALTVLERIKLMTVFDFVGLTEGLSELRQDLERLSKPTEGGRESEPVNQRTCVGDSDEEEEMLDDNWPETAADLVKDNVATVSESRRELLIIDSLSHVAGPMLKRNVFQGNALLASTMHSISQITKAHQLCTVLTIGATPYTHTKDEPPSAFASCTLHPLLGRSLSHQVDLQLLIHHIPKAAADAEVVYGGGSTQYHRPETVMVVEVLQDRNGDRVGRWTALSSDTIGRLKGIV